MDKYEFNKLNYVIEKGDNDLFSYDVFKEYITDYFNDYDYIFVDESYNKLRFKGFYDSKNRKAKDLNNINFLDNYIKLYCSYGCRWVLLKKIK